MISVSNEWKKQLGCYSIPNRPYLVPANDIKIEYEIGRDERIPSVYERQVYIESHASEIINTNYYPNGNTKLKARIYFDTDSVAWQSPFGSFHTGSSYFAVMFNRTHVFCAYGSQTKNVVATFDFGYIDIEINGNVFKIGGQEIIFNAETFTCGYPLQFFASSNNYNIACKLYSTEVSDDNTSTEYIPVFASNMDKYGLYDVVGEEFLISPNGGLTGNNIMSIFSKKDLMNVELNLESDLLSFSLPDDSLIFETDNVDGRWNPDNPTGDYVKLLDNIRVILSVGYKFGDAPYPHNGLYPHTGLHPSSGGQTTEWKKIATMFMTDRDTPQNGITATFTARNVLSLMTQKFDVYKTLCSGHGGFVDPDELYDFGDEISLSAVIREAFDYGLLQAFNDNVYGGSANIGHWTSNIYIDNSLQNIYVVIPYTTREEGGETIYEWDFDYSCAEVIQLCANAGHCVIRCDENGDVRIEKVNEELSDYYIDQFVSYQNSEYNAQPILKGVSINDSWYYQVPDVLKGEIQSIDNPLIQSTAQATEAGQWVDTVMGKRKVGDEYTNGATISGEYRADIRLQPTDVITNRNKYATNRVAISRVHYTYAGAWHGEYEGRVIRSIPNIDLEGNYYAGEIYANGEY